jgi:alcohol dehydrogenase (cytochrome c)
LRAADDDLHQHNPRYAFKPIGVISMPRLALMASAALLLSASNAYAQSQQDLIKGSANTDNVVNYGMSYSQHRYSTLTQINKSNARRLVPVWSLSLENELGEQAQPMVYEGVMFVANAKFTVAIEAATGKQLWRTPVNFDPASTRVVC